MCVPSSPLPSSLFSLSLFFLSLFVDFFKDLFAFPLAELSMKRGALDPPLPEERGEGSDLFDGVDEYERARLLSAARGRRLDPPLLVMALLTVAHGAELFEEGLPPVAAVASDEALRDTRRGERDTTVDARPWGGGHEIW